MTRKEFFEARAKMHFEKTHGVTACDEGSAEGAEHQRWMATKRTSSRNGKHSNKQGGSDYFHFNKVTGEAGPTVSRSLMRLFR